MTERDPKTDDALLPEALELSEALIWLLAGAPAAHRDISAHRAVKILLQLIEALPSRLLAEIDRLKESRE